MTSDTPVMLSDPEGVRFHAGKLSYSKRFWFTFPLNTTHCLHGHFRSRGDQHGSIRASEVRAVNRETIARASLEVYAAWNSDAIQQLVNKFTKARGVDEEQLLEDLAGLPPDSPTL